MVKTRRILASEPKQILHIMEKQELQDAIRSEDLYPKQSIIATTEKGSTKIDIQNDILLDITDSQKQAIYSLIRTQYVSAVCPLKAEITKHKNMVFVVLKEMELNTQYGYAELKETTYSILRDTQHYKIGKRGKVEKI